MPSENIPIHRPSYTNNIVAMKFAGSLIRVGIVLLLCPACFADGNPVAAAATKRVAPTEKQLETLSRALKQKNPSSAYSQLSAFATQKSTGVLGMRAALALGYFDYSKGNYSQAAKWFERAKGDPLLRDYSLYWSGETELATNHSAEALTEFKKLRADFPNSVMAEQTLQSLGEAALAANRPADAVAALDAYSATTDKPALLFLRAEAHEQAGARVEAAEDYRTVYLRFAASEQAREAGMKLEFLRSALPEIPAVTLADRLARATTLFNAKEWSEARTEYTRLLPELSGAERERAELRSLECGMSLGAGPAETAALKIEDPDVDAERFYTLAQIYRTQQQESLLVPAVDSVVSRAPASRWADAALFLAGNYFWVQLDRDRAAGYYKRVVEGFPESPDAQPSQWRETWVAVLKRQPEAAELLADHLRRYPGSPFTPDALYWLGRLAEEGGNGALARAYYRKLTERYAQNFFQNLAAARLGALGQGPEVDADVLATIPPAPAEQPVGDSIPAGGAERQARADALRTIAFDASAELELRAGYAATGEPRLLLEAAQTAAKAGHCGAAIVTIRQIYPQLETRPFDEVPHEVWLASYAIPYEDSIRKWSAKAGVDPMLVAGLIRQESAFDPESRSGADAIGLMQLLPKTGRLMAKQLKIRYSRMKLYDPDYNIRLGTAYLAGLIKSFGGVESALAAYNGGEDRVTFWTAGQTYRDLPEFVDSIPFTETREYVEIVTRNAAIYRRLYGDPDELGKAGTRGRR